MITAGISAATVALLALFGVTPTAGQIAGIVVAAKVLVVATGAIIAVRVSRKRRAAAEAQPPAAPTDEARPTGSG